VRWHSIKNNVLSVVLVLIAVAGGSVWLNGASAAAASDTTAIHSGICNSGFMAPLITAPTTGTTTESSSTTVKGTGEAGMNVTILVNGQTKAATAISSSGTFSVQVPLGIGTNSIVASMTDGCTTTKDSPAVTVERKRKTPASAPANGGTPSGSPAASGGSSTPAPSRSTPVVNADTLGNEEPPAKEKDTLTDVLKITSIRDGDHTDVTPRWVAGIAHPGSVVILYVNGKEVARVVADEEGMFGAEVNLRNGSNTIKVVEEYNGKRVGEKRLRVTYTPPEGSPLMQAASRWQWYVGGLVLLLLIVLCIWAAYRRHRNNNEEAGL
jgi:hypothetical protein